MLALLGFLWPNIGENDERPQTLGFRVLLTVTALSVR
jgi:hypothetical protein